MTRVLFSAMVILALASSAAAFDLPVGARAGYTDWDGLSQMHLGAHVKLGEIIPYIELTPNVEMGFGDDTNILSLNGDLTYRFTELTTSPWGLYGGGTLSMLYIDNDLMDGDVDLGLGALIGGSRELTNGHEVSLEIRLGVLDSPDIKATVGYTFF